MRHYSFDEKFVAFDANLVHALVVLSTWSVSSCNFLANGFFVGVIVVLLRDMFEIYGFGSPAICNRFVDNCRLTD